MSTIRMRARSWGAAGLATATILAGLGFATTAEAVTGTTAPHAACASPLFGRTVHGRSVRSDAAVLKTAARRSHLSLSRLRRIVKDHDSRIDRCGHVFYADSDLMATPQEQAAAAADASAGGSVTALHPLADTFNLESKPGSNRTIYLNFKGGTVTGTAWNQSYGASIVADPYSKDATVDTSFSDDELTQIQKAWQSVAEDYAPFDVNVTTKDPGTAAIDRTDANDQVYGTEVFVTNGGVIYNSCGCGGVAYVNVFNSTGATHASYQPAWVFSDGTTKSGKYMAEAIAHEVGHNFGLSHDGTSQSGYSSGTSPWGPIMGAPYSQPITQWSQGEYPDANNHEDDTAIIATGAPVRADDNGNTAGTATPIAPGTPVNGVISTRADVDAFKFTGSGTTTITAKGADGMPDLDIQMTVLDQNGNTVATVNPATQYVSAFQANGLDASWTGTLPAGGATYTVLLDGVGDGNPATAGLYSDYGSLGGYTLSVTSGGSANTVSVTNPGNQTGTVGTAKSLQIQAADSASGQALTYSATGLPAGMAINVGTGLISGTPTTAGTSTVTVTASDSTGATGSTSFTWTVGTPAANTVTVTNPGNQTGTVGTAKSLQIKASDSAAGQTLTYSATGLPAGMSINAGTGLISGTPTTAATTTVKVTAKDTTGATGSASFTWAVAAAPTTGCSGNLVTNGGFESGTTGWTASSGVVGSFTDEPARSGSKVAWLDGYGAATTDSVSRSIAIPAGCKAKLSFWLHIDTDEDNAGDPTAYDKLTVKAGSTVLARFSNLDAANGYVLRQYDLSAFAGQTVSLGFTGVEDYSLQTSFVLDDVSVDLS